VVKASDLKSDSLWQCRPVTFLHYVQTPFLPPPSQKKIKKIYFF